MLPASKQERYPSNWIINRISSFPKSGAYDNQVYSLVDGFENTSVLTTSTVGNTFVGITATFSSLNDYASYSAVFDQYRMMGVEVTLFPGTASTLSTVFGRVHTVIDYDDATSITPAQALDYPNCIISGPADTQVRSFKPHAANALYAGGVFTSFGNVASPWIDCSSAGVVHYGLKVAVSPTVVAVTFDSVVRVWLEFRNVR
jgi:hypothetical protein